MRNGIIGALKQLGQKNPVATLAFARKHLHSADAEVRRQIVHGIELRGRTHPEDVLPLLREMHTESDPRVREMVVHVLGQISYKSGCLDIVIRELKTWHDRDLVKRAIGAMRAVHAEQAYCTHSLEDANALIRAELGEDLD